MRFFCDGPSIPDQLLERRDQGRVVFLCGAGVSLDAGMPNFYNLTKHVVDFFDPPKGSPIETEFRIWVEDSNSGENRPKTPLDQIFHLLHQEYGREEVNTLVAQRLRDADLRSAEIKEHSVIAKISSDQEGNPQIVTTNFDRLFERGMEVAESEIYEPPAFPDIALGMPLTGITYLHGRLQEPSSVQHPYILSSADFGRAYLSEGWATSFIRSLLKTYTVVLVGYQAEDPPVKYLLQGLNHDGMSNRSNLYAFDKGEPEEIEAKWRDRGVMSIAFNDYPSLWQSLEAWADRASDPRRWRSRVIDKAMNGPRALSAYERGQVAHLVRTTPGARLFAGADPSPPAEWLCVFDARCRVAKKHGGDDEDKETFDPFEEYGLDDDPPRLLESGRQSNWIHDHILEWRQGDTNPHTFHRLSGLQLAGFEDMPPRLLHLSNWIAKHLDSPQVAWWAARQRGIHPRFVNNIRRELRWNKELVSEAHRVWNLILEYQSDSRNFGGDHCWYEIIARVSREGWTASVFREFEAVTAPILSYESPLGVAASKPPFGCWVNTLTQEIAQWKVKFPHAHEVKLEIPDEVLESVFRIANGHFHRAAELMQDVDTIFLTAPTCYPERDFIGHNSNSNSAFEWFLELFALMALNYPSIARGYASLWSADEKFYFRRLKLFALNHVELFDPDDVTETLLALSQESFWDPEVRRELLFLIGDRWESFSETNRAALIERLFNGPEKKEYWSDEEFPIIKNRVACRYIRWLVLHGKELVEDQAVQLKSMISALPNWEEGWALSLTEESFGSVGRGRTDETPDQIIDLPVTEIAERAKAEHKFDFDSFTEKIPFTGLVKANPRKSLSSLSHSAKRGEFPEALWSTLINDWPEKTRPRLFLVFLHRLKSLPNEVIRELRYPIGRWLNERLAAVFKFDEVLAWNVFDHLVSGLVSENGEAAASGLGERLIDGEGAKRSRRTIEHAFNGPIGDAIRGLHGVLDSLKLDQGATIPTEFKSRFEYLIAAPGEGRDHAVAIIAWQIGRLYFLDPEWTKDKVMPWFDFEHELSEPAWSGFLSAANLPPQEVSVKFKLLLVDLFPVLYKWNWDEGLTRVASQIVVELAVLRNGKPDQLNVGEARHCLRSMNDRNRQDAISQLGNIGLRENNGWSEYVIPFIDTVWPRERKFRTSNLVLSWVSLLEDAGEKFPEVLCVVRRYLVPIERESHWLYSFRRGFAGKEPLTVRHPKAVLELLYAVIPKSAEGIPNELTQILDLIEEAEPSLASDRRFVGLMSLIEQT